MRNEEDVIPELVRRLETVLSSLPLEYELIFVDDDSTDRSLEILRQHAIRNPRVKVLTMSRRFGVFECTLAGIDYATGDAVVFMDADLQDPPEVIPELVAKWREGADMVYTVRTRRLGEHPLRMWLTRAAYKVIGAISEIDLPVEAGDFRLLSRRLVNEVVRLKETYPYLKGLVTWVGFNHAAVPYVRAPRAAGATHNPLFRSTSHIRTFLSGITSFSMVPLYAIFVVGFFASVAAAIGWVAVWIAEVRGGADAGAADWILFATFLWATLLMAVGIVAIYLSRVYRDVRGRPRYIVKETIGFDDDR